MRARNLVLSALFCALTAAGAYLTVPIPYGEITLQLFFVLLTGFLLPPRLAFQAELAYVVLGLVGAPVFSGFTGGLSVLASPTFGFVVGLMFGTPITAALYRRLKGGRFARIPALLSGLAGIAVTYLFGVLHGLLIMKFVLTEEISPWFIAWNWCLVYLPFDLVKLLAAAAIARLLLRRLPPSSFC